MGIALLGLNSVPLLVVYMNLRESVQTSIPDFRKLALSRVGLLSSSLPPTKIIYLLVSEIFLIISPCLRATPFGGMEPSHSSQSDTGLPSGVFLQSSPILAVTPVIGEASGFFAIVHSERHFPPISMSKS
ncbi:hypothetical protein ES703_45992 [subsurface metagenome]